MEVDIGQLFWIGLEGHTLTGKEAEFMTDNNIGGVTLFGRNLDNPEQIHKLCTDLYNLKDKMPSKMPPFVAIDMEGGRVHRLKDPFTQWPSIGAMSALDSTSVAFKFANMMGAELRALGVNVDFAPCVDVLTNEKNELIGDRSFGSDPEYVAKMASAVIRGYIKSGIIACAKHFPGHGNTIIDSHEDLPIEEVDMDTLANRELIPFKKAMRARLDLIMTAHIQYSKIDSELPATLSSKFVRDLLKGELKYKNLVITDDLDMKALTKNFSREEITVKAFQAGCDIMLYCNEFDSPGIGLESVKKAIRDKEISAPQIQESLHKNKSLKEKSILNQAPLPLPEAQEFFGPEEHKTLAAGIREGNVAEDMKQT